MQRNKKRKQFHSGVCFKILFKTLEERIQEYLVLSIFFMTINFVLVNIRLFHSMSHKGIDLSCFCQDFTRGFPSSMTCLSFNTN